MWSLVMAAWIRLAVTGAVGRDGGSACSAPTLVVDGGAGKRVDHIATRRQTGTVKPRRLILDLFGDYLQYVGAEVRVPQLARLLHVFNVRVETTRATMKQLAREGWFTVRRSRRRNVYTLTPRMLAVLDEGRARIFAPPPQTWSGVWTKVVFPTRPEDEHLRTMLAWNGFGPLTPSTWLAPGDRLAKARTLTDERVEVLVCRSEGLEHDRELAGRCWDIERLDREYRGFIGVQSHWARSGLNPSRIQAFGSRTEIITKYREFPFRDPGLPPGLRPEPWPGVPAYETFRGAHEQLGPLARAYVSEIIGREVPEPPPVDRLD
jgi:phenylacetic acid degradation operon negative regulatory protein